MENTGLSEVMGSWNTMAMRAPRTWRMASASLASRSSPSRSTWPAAIRPGGGTRRMMESDVTLLPQPLSPTRPSTSPRSMAKLMPSTARSTPWLVANCVSSPSTERSGAISALTTFHPRPNPQGERGSPVPSPLAGAKDGVMGTQVGGTAHGRYALDLEPRIERVAEPVAEEIHRERRQHDGEAREGGEPPRGRGVVAAVGEHPAPGRCVRLDAQAQERQRRLVDDHEGQLQRGHHDDGRERVRQDVA